MIILNNSGTSKSTYIAHGLSHSMHNGRRHKAASLPVCPKCERVGFRDKGWQLNKTMSCPHCGYHGKATHVLSAYVEDRLYK
jgi:predicted Zn-ribbon and HTH transcriptional regulator